MWFHVAKWAPFFLVSSMANCVRAEQAAPATTRAASIATTSAFFIGLSCVRVRHPTVSVRRFYFTAYPFPSRQTP